MNAEERNCQNCKSQFAVEADDFDFYKKVEVPPPTWCPECRLIRRLCWRNERSLHKRTCELCGKTTLAVYAEAAPIHVYCNECWWSDKWEAMEQGVDFDPSRPFLEQFFDLMHKVPMVSRFGLNPSLVNSEYTNMVGYLKNCYLLTHSDYSEDCSYGSNVTNSKQCIDAYLIDKCESCYEITNCRDCYRTMFSVDCVSCHNVYFSKNCSGCTDCFGCANLRNQKYHIFNQPYTKEEYEAKLKDLYPSDVLKIQDAFANAEELWRGYPQKYMHERLNSHVTGDYIYNSKNVRDTFLAGKLEDSRFCMMITPGEGVMSNSYDFTHFGENSELMYEALMCGWCSRVRFSWFITVTGQDIEYSIGCITCKDLFGCVGLKKKQYCILNKQYSKEEFEALRARILKHMDEMPYVDKQRRVYKYGEFFPMEASPFGYNETAHIYFPLAKEDAVQRGYVWREPDERNYTPTKTGSQLPLEDFLDSVKEEVVACDHKGKCMHNCSTAFRFIPYELAFYRQNKLPLPRLCTNCRHAERVARTNPPRLWARECMCRDVEAAVYANTSEHFHGANACPNQFETSYSPENPTIVYCEQCYQQEMI